MQKAVINISGTSWSLFGKLSFLGSQFGLIILLNKLTSPEIVGVYSISLSILTPVFLFSGLHGRMRLSIETNSAAHLSDYLSLRVITGVFSVVAALALFFVMIGSGREEFFWIFISLSIYKFVEGLADVFYGRFQGEADLKSIAIGQGIRGIGCIVLFSSAFFIFDSIVLSFAAFAAWSALLLVLYEWRISGRVRFCCDVYRMFRLAADGVALGLVLMLGSLLQYAPNYIIAQEMSLDDVGYFSTIFFLVQGVTIVSSALFEAHVKDLKNARDKGHREEFDRMVERLRVLGAFLGLIVVAGALLAGEWLLAFLFTPDISAHQDVLIILAIVVFFRTWLGVYSIVCTVLYLHKQQVAINLISLLVTLFFCLLLIPSSGLVGAAVSVLLATIVSRALFYRLACRGVAWV